MGNRMFERFPRGHFAPVYHSFAPADLFGEPFYKSRIPGCTIDHYRARFAGFSGGPSTIGGFGATNVALEPAASAVTYADDIGAAARIVSDYAIKVVQKALTASGVKAAVITSTLRLPAEQAEIMYRMAKQDMAAQYQLYGANGDKVIDVFKANKDKDKAEVVELMKKKIEELLNQGTRVSQHVVSLATYEKLNVLDIGVNSTKRVAGDSFSKDKLTTAFVALEKQGYIKKLIDETGKKNNCWHLEIVPDAKKL